MTVLAYDFAPAEVQFFDPNTLDWQELAKLGFESYRHFELWCVRSGQAQKDDTAAIAAAWLRLQAAPPTPPREVDLLRRQTLERLVTDEFRWRGQKINWLADNPGAQDAFKRLLLHVDRFMDVKLGKNVYRGGRYKRLLQALMALAYHHRDWIRPLEEWSCVEPKDGLPRRCDQFFSLVNWLLARYEVPVPMHSVWFEGVDERGLQQQAWFKHLANGGNIRDLDTPIHFTRRMAHQFQHVPRLGTIEKSMRWAQVVAMGGNRFLASAILKTRLGRQYEEDEFWSGVVLFLVNNAMMDPTWAGPIVDYVHNMKFAPRRIVQEGGGVVEGPPEQPNFTMKGRSANKILRQVEAWHGQISREEFVDFQSWPASVFRSWEMDDETEELGKVKWSVQEMLSSWELAAEGRAMNHCVVSYSNQCADGKTSIWSICAHLEGAEERENVLTVAVDIRERAVTQARGRYNASPNKKKRSKREGRKEEEGGYIPLLDRSEFVMQEWMSRERLRRDD